MCILMAIAITIASVLLRRHQSSGIKNDIITSNIKYSRYIEGPIQNRYTISHLLKSIISNVLLEYEAFLTK